jgi:hypothetical protein
MDVFALLFIVSFLVLLVTLVVMHIRKGMNNGKGDTTAKEEVETIVENCYFETVSDVVGKMDYELVYDPSSGKDHSIETKYKVNSNGAVEFIDCRWDDESWMQREVNEAQEKWKESLPKHNTRIKLRNSRKLRNKRKGKK